MRPLTASLFVLACLVVGYACAHRTYARGSPWDAPIKEAVWWVQFGEWRHPAVPVEARQGVVDWYGCPEGMVRVEVGSTSYCETMKENRP